MENERIFSRKTQSCYLSAAKIICFSFLTFVPVGVFAEPVDVPAVQVTQQAGVVKGTVVDAQGETIIGASVTIKGGTVGTITDIDGNFSLTVPAGSQLVVSFIGYIRQFVTPKVGQPLNIVLQEDTKVLDEVVVVGYGTQKAKNITGSVEQISTKDIENLPVSNLAEALSGQVAGLSVSGGSGRPGEGATLSIRQSFNYSKDGGNSIPLVIIDDVIQVDPTSGLPTLEQFNMLDMSEVESVSVLRDASAAIYGSRASQGAIIVKTKRGKEGAPKISYSGKFGFNDAISHGKTLNAYEYGQFANSFILASGKAKITDTNKLFSNSELETMKGLNYDWVDEAWSSAASMQHSVNVNGGTNKATYFAGASYYTQGANLGGQNYDKWTFRTGVDVKLTSDLKFSASVSANSGETQKSFTKTAGNISDGSFGGLYKGEQADYGFMLHMPRYIPWSVNLDGQEYFTSPSIGPHQASGNAASANSIGSWNYFALQENGSKQVNKTFSYNANFSMSYAVPFIKGLTLRGTYSTSRAASDTEQNAMPFTLALGKKMQQNERHLYEANIEKSDYELKLNDKSSRVTYIDELAESYQANFYVTYDRDFGSHSISAMASAERAESSMHKKVMQYLNPPDFYAGTSVSAGTMDYENSITSRSESATMSYLGRINYSYADRYMAQFIFRSDASTKFPANNAWGFFPGVSLGWITSEEPWFKTTLPWFEYLKVRASWGQTGKDNIKSWAYIQTYGQDLGKGFQFGSNGGTFGNGLTTGKSPNPSVHWDKTNKYNLGFDTRFLGGRLGATIDMYYDINSDILNREMMQVVGTPISLGGSYAEENFGRIDAYGMEVSLSWRDQIGKVRYNVGVNFGLNGNQIKEWPELSLGYPSTNVKRPGESTITPGWGYKVWRGTSAGDGILRTDGDVDAYWNYLATNANASGTTPAYFDVIKKDGLKKGMLAYQDISGNLNADGSLNGPDGQIKKEQDMDKLTKRNQTYGFTTRLGADWKGVSFSAQIGTSWGGLRTIDNCKIPTSSGQMLWSPESYWSDMYDEYNNVGGRYPNIAYADNLLTSDFWTINTFRCYLKNLSIGYTLPKDWLRAAKVESIKISLTGNNLWDFYNPYPKKYRNMYDASSSAYPTLRTWAVGVNLTF